MTLWLTCCHMFVFKSCFVALETHQCPELYDQIWEQEKAWFSKLVGYADRTTTLSAYPGHGSSPHPTLSCLDPFTYCIYSLMSCIIYCATHIILMLLFQALWLTFEYSALSQFLWANITWSVDLTCLCGLNGIVFTAMSHGTLCPVVSKLDFDCECGSMHLSFGSSKSIIWHLNKSCFFIACWLYTSEGLGVHLRPLFSAFKLQF